MSTATAPTTWRPSANRRSPSRWGSTASRRRRPTRRPAAWSPPRLRARSRQVGSRQVPARPRASVRRHCCCSAASRCSARPGRCRHVGASVGSSRRAVMGLRDRSEIDRHRARWNVVAVGLAVTGAVLLALGLPTHWSAAPGLPERAVDPPATTTSTQGAKSSAEAPRTPTTGPLMDSVAPVEITIPVLRVYSPLVDLGLTDDGALEVPGNGDDAGWYTGAPTPGALGPAI